MLGKCKVLAETCVWLQIVVVAAVVVAAKAHFKSQYRTACMLLRRTCMQLCRCIFLGISFDKSHWRKGEKLTRLFAKH